MLIFKICLSVCLLLLTTAESIDPADNQIKNKSKTPAVFLEELAFETSHKIKRPDEDFHTSHKISNFPKAQYNKVNSDDEDTTGSLMQLQQTQNLLSTKERPELNPILSALINEDVMKSIEAKRAIEEEQVDTRSVENTDSATTEGPSIVLTTAKPPQKEISLEDDQNVGLIDQPISLDVAGSENSPKSRIQIKKGPNGMDYEYEYVYYYYDDDEAAAGKKQAEAESTVVEETSKKGSQPQERGKSRYTNIERSTTSAPDNVLVSGKGKGRASTSVVSEDVDEGRLPVITRFPSRGKNAEVQPTVSLEGLENTASASNEKSKKISVKRPSLELVDSETFNTDEKQAKGSPRNGDSEKSAPAAVSEMPKSEDVKPKNNEEDEAPVVDDIDQTTPLMEKAALDLYAILANENLEMDMTTDLDKESTTELPDTTESDGSGLTTFEGEIETIIPTTPSTTTTTTTTEAPTTTSTTTTTTTTTTAAPASLFGAGRRGLATAGRNRFRLKSGNASSATSTTEVPSTAATASDSDSGVGLKGRNRFHRPSFGNRNRASASPAPVAPAEEEVVQKEEEKSVAATPSVRGRTRNRFSVRGQGSTTTTTESNQNQNNEQNDEENQVSSTTVRSLRGRPTLSLRGRSRIGSRTTTATQAPATEEDGTGSAPLAQSEATEEKPSPLPTRPSRFNLNRVGGSGATAGNRLLPRARLNTLRLTTTTPAQASDANNDISNDVKEESDEDKNNAAKSESEAATTAATVGGLNRLKSRPRLQLQAKTDNRPKVSPIPARKVNPLLARRKLALGPSTTESTVPSDEPSDGASENTSSTSDDSDKKDGDSNQSATEEANQDENTELPETTTKQARGLGLLTQRRRLPIRKPGTLL